MCSFLFDKYDIIPLGFTRIPILNLKKGEETMYFNGTFYKTYEQLEQDIISRKKSMEECLEASEMGQAATLRSENNKLLKFMKRCETRTEAITIFHVKLDSLIEDFEDYLLKMQATLHLYFAKEAINKVLKEHEVMESVLKYFPIHKPFKMRQLRKYLGKEEAMRVTLSLAEASVFSYDRKCGRIYLTNYGRYILNIML